MIEFAPGQWTGLDGLGEMELTKLRASAELAVDRAAMHLETEVKKTLGPGGGPRTGRWYVVPQSSARSSGKRRTNPPRHQASAPGEPPARLLGKLAQSITHSTPTWDGWTVQSEVGTSQPQARRLELGGVDSRGVRILPRPYFAPTMMREEAAIDRILERAVAS